MSNQLADRFEAVQTLRAQEQQVQEVNKMSFEELGRQVIVFGEAKKGQKFVDVVNHDPSYCKWFLKKWGTSPKREHQLFSHYLQRWIERQELEQGMNPNHTEKSPGESPSQVCPKAKSMPATAGGRSSMKEPIDLELEDDESEWWDKVMPNNNRQESENTKRLDQLEGVLSEVISQLKLLTQPAGTASQ